MATKNIKTSEMVDRLAKTGMHANMIAEVLKVTVPTVHYHLKKLRAVDTTIAEVAVGDDFVFTTSNIGLSCALMTLGHKPVEVGKNENGWLYMIFKKDEALINKKTEFWNNTLSVPARNYQCAFFYIKKLLQVTQPGTAIVDFTQYDELNTLHFIRETGI